MAESKEKRSGPSHTFAEGSTAFQMACASKQDFLMKILMEHPRIELNRVNVDGDAAVHFAARRGNIFIIDQLLAAGDNIQWNIKNNFGYTPLHVAVLNNQSAIVEKLLTIKTIIADEKDNDGKTALDYALQYHVTEFDLTVIVGLLKAEFAVLLAETAKTS